MKRFSAPASMYQHPSRPPDYDDRNASFTDGSKKVKTAQSFESLFNSESLSDIVLDINHGQFVFHAHKMIVGLKSERLAALITSASSPATDNISKPVLYLLEGSECSAVFSRFLYFIYSGAVWLHRDYVIPLFKLSTKYGVVALATHCEKYTLQLLNKCLKVDLNYDRPSSALSVATVCDLYEEDEYREDIKRTAFCVLCCRFAELASTERWISCAWITVRDLLSCDECVCEENLILVAATDWMKRNKLQDKVRIQEILASIRYPRLPRRVLYHLYSAASFKNFPHVQDLIDAAIRYHCFKDVPEAQNEFQGVQYRERRKGRTRYNLCGEVTTCFSECQEATSRQKRLNSCDSDESVPNPETNSSCGCMEFYDNGPDLLASSRLEETISTHHHPVRRGFTAHSIRHAHCLVISDSGHHGTALNPQDASVHSEASPAAAVQPEMHCHHSSLS